LEKLQK
jgi:hypothetical protein